MEETLNKTKEVVIIVDDRKHKAKFLEKISNREIVFEIVERDHQYIKTKSGYKCQVLFAINTEKGIEKFFLEGKIASESANRAIVWASTAIMTDRRKDIRYEIPSVIARLEEQKFLRTNIINGNLSNISSSGATIHTSVPLRVNHEYLLTTKFRIRRDLKPFSAVFVVAYCNKKSKIYINIYSSGGYFKKSSISPEDRKILDTLLKGMEEF
ncbi:MAG: hypothetical protein ACOX1Z_00065 [Candidatus Ratteibacteria bacterium]|jgi:hypothetical protein